LLFSWPSPRLAVRIILFGNPASNGNPT
jgi:hypothetical protein